MAFGALTYTKMRNWPLFSAGWLCSPFLDGGAAALSSGKKRGGVNCGKEHSK